MINVAVVNTYRYNQICKRKGVALTGWWSPHDLLRTELIRQLSGIAIDEPPPKEVYRRPSLTQARPQHSAQMHLVKHNPAKHNCVLCCEQKKKYLNFFTFCQVCEVNLHGGKTDCFGRYHELKFAQTTTTLPTFFFSDAFNISTLPFAPNNFTCCAKLSLLLMAHQSSASDKSNYCPFL